VADAPESARLKTKASVPPELAFAMPAAPPAFSAPFVVVPET
jgi:hypothetical protein